MRPSPSRCLEECKEKLQKLSKLQIVAEEGSSGVQEEAVRAGEDDALDETPKEDLRESNQTPMTIGIARQSLLKSQSIEIERSQRNRGEEESKTKH